MIALLSTLAFIASAVAVRVYLAVSRRHVVDEPGARSSHSIPTPTGGGFPAVVAFLVVGAIAVQMEAVSGGTRFWVSFGSASVLSLLGLLDDAFDLPAAIRFLCHTLVALAIVYFLGHPGPQAGTLSFVAAAVSVIAIVGLINAFNFMDGIDALVGGTGIVIVLFLAMLTHDSLWFFLAASYAGFLVFNLPPARIFMGDAGSTTLGGLVAIALLSGRDSLEPRHLLLFGPLIGDSAYTLVRRLLRGEHVWRAHHSHLYQRLIRVGHSHARISACYVVATLVVGLLVTVGGGVTSAVVAAIVCVLAIVLIERYLTRAVATLPVAGKR